MKLYQGWHSSASWRVRWALAWKGLAYESHWLDIAAAEHHAVLEPINPLLSVPTVKLDDGDVLYESVAIIEWLDETYPERPLLPLDAKQRAHVRMLVQLVNADIHPLQNTRVRKAVAQDELGQKRWAARWIEQGLRAYEAHLRQHSARFSVGDELSMAELFLVPQTLNAARFGADIRDCTRVLQIYEACLQLPEVIATHPEQAARDAAAARRVG
jgi:maleylpyruvate isomerase